MRLHASMTLAPFNLLLSTSQRKTLLDGTKALTWCTEGYNELCSHQGFAFCHYRTTSTKLDEGVGQARVNPAVQYDFLVSDVISCWFYLIRAEFAMLLT